MILIVLSCYFLGLSFWENRITTQSIPEQSATVNQDIVPEAVSNVSETRMNINSANKEMLMELPGIGETLAERILEKRDSIGGFRSTEQLLEVEGIGEKIFERFKDEITVE